jgi:Cu+-exporting ATPase
MPVDEATAEDSSVFEGRKYSFCSPRCKQKFEANPSAYVGPPLPAGDSGYPGHAHHSAHTTRESPGHVHDMPVVASTVPPGRIYTCPMHPEIVRNAPGDCPLCGMALVLLAVRERVMMMPNCTIFNDDCGPESRCHSARGARDVADDRHP